MLGKVVIWSPFFTIKKIEKHRQNSGKTADTAIIKTLDISSESIYSLGDADYFCVKGTCKASMKKEKRNVYVALDKNTGNVIHADCSCPAGKSGYCNHVMALLFT